MCIGYVVKRYPRYSETFIVNEILAHEAAGIDVRIFALLPPEDTHFQDIIARVHAPVYYLPFTAGKARRLWEELTDTAQTYPAVWKILATATDASVREVLQALKLVQKIQAQGITHLHAHFATSATTVARIAAAICGITYSFTAHAKDIFHEDVETDALSLKFAAAAAAVTVSDYNLAYLRNRLGPAADRIQRIYNGLDLENFPYKSPQQRNPQIVAIGRLVEKKGFIHLIDACHVLKQQGHRFHCRIIGTGELVEVLQARITALDLQTCVELTGPRPQRDIIAELHSAAVLAAPCVVGQDGNRDGLPTVLLESMALGTPCVSTDVTGIPEILNDNVTGLLVEQEDPAELATALAHLLKEPALRVRIAEQARALIETEFDIHRNTAQLRTCFSCYSNTKPEKAAAK